MGSGKSDAVLKRLLADNCKNNRFAAVIVINLVACLVLLIAVEGNVTKFFRLGYNILNRFALCL